MNKGLERNVNLDVQTEKNPGQYTFWKEMKFYQQTIDWVVYVIDR